MTATEPHFRSDDVQPGLPTAAAPTGPARPARSTQQLLASAYAHRLSLLRCDASDVELAESQRLIARLEGRLRAGRAAAQDDLMVDVRGDGASRHTVVLPVDSTIYLG